MTTWLRAALLGLWLAVPVSAAAAPFSVTVLDRVRITGDPTGPNFQNATGDVSFTGGPVASAALVVDLESDCFPFAKWLTNPPPAPGQFPPGCDEFDRLLSVVLDGSPGVELLRGVTPFGGPLRLAADITDVVNGLPGAHQLKVTIGTIGKNRGWTVTARIDSVPGTPPRNVLAVLPLAYATLTSASHAISTPFSVPPGTTSARLEYRTQGFGGGPCSSGDEFCQRVHHVRIDGADVQPDAVLPWRDCACMCDLDTQPALPPLFTAPFSYCRQNPTGSRVSALAPRSNWCPGSMTPPLVWDPAPSHTAGPHTFEASVDDVSQFGSLLVSAVFFAFGPPTPTAVASSTSGSDGVSLPAGAGLPLAAAILPGSRSVLAGCCATAFATVINAGAETATGVGIAPATFVPANFLYQTTDPATNVVMSSPNVPADVPPGQAQSYVIVFTSTGPFSPTDVALSFGGANTAAVTPLPGVNTLLLSAGAVPVPDIIALGATPSGDGVVRVPGAGGNQAFSVATANVGSSAPITVSADTGGASLPLIINMCETNPSTGQCVSAIGPSVATQIDAGATPTFTVLVTASGPVTFEPATHRIFVRFRDGSDVTRGATNAAVTTE